MSRVIDPPIHCRTTDHSDEIFSLRTTADALDAQRKHTDNRATVAMLRCAAALLEVHDDTGISLDQWIGPRELVEVALEFVGRPGKFLENHI